MRKIVLNIAKYTITASYTAGVILVFRPGTDFI